MSDHRLRSDESGEGAALRRELDISRDEREKAASALRESLARQIAEGDHNLRSHIEQQFESVKAALVSAELLERQRFGAVRDTQAAEQAQMNRRFAAITDAMNHADGHLRTSINKTVDLLNQSLMATDARFQERLAGLARETDLVADAAKEAIGKAEMANEKRFEAVNEFRQTLSDQAAHFVPREVIDAQFGEVIRRVAALESRTAGFSGEAVGERRRDDIGARQTGLYVAFAGVVVALLTVLAIIAPHLH